MNPINLIIYESSSFGGCYKYSICLFEHYSKHKQVKLCKLIIPSNSEFASLDVNAILSNDLPLATHRMLKKFYFIFRQFYNPIRLLFFLINEPRSFVLLNDFEQITAFFWVPIYKLFLSKHRFGVFLHDPDRDDYPPSKKLSQWSMKLMLSLCSFGFYHEHLPDKSYYRDNSFTKYFSVPHGIYEPHKRSEIFFQEIQAHKGCGKIILSILGNIRSEKRYEDIIRLLPLHNNWILLIAGSSANSNVDTWAYKQEAQMLKVEDQILWVERYLTESELTACIEASDVILLNYSSTFTSQSGILNVIAPFKKRLIVSETNSSLSLIVKRFNIGFLCDLYSLDSLEMSILNSTKMENKDTYWEDYLSYASWTNHVNLVCNLLIDLK